MKKFVLLALLLSACAHEPVSPVLGLAAKSTAPRSVPAKPRFIAADLYAPVAKSVAPFPAPDSIEQRADELNLLTMQEVRTKADCERAAGEVKVSLEHFYGGPQGALNPAQVETLAPFFEQIRNDSDYFIQRLKGERARKRPFQYIKGLEPCVKREMSPAYPSGHATLARLYALILSDMFPAKTKELLKRSDIIAEDRVLAGMHHRSDIIAGQALGERLYKEFSKSSEFRRELSNLERALSHHGRVDIRENIFFHRRAVHDRDDGAVLHADDEGAVVR
jgi:acid phosphatase (class A)